MNEKMMTRHETRQWLRSLGLKGVRLPIGDRTLYIAAPIPDTTWVVEPFGDGFMVSPYVPPPAPHAFTGTSFRLNISLDTLPARPFEELAAILRKIADDVARVNEKNDLPNGGWISHSQTIRDARGNDVGRFAVKPTSER